ncbi:MAG: hypothetical protein IJ041_07425 [Clostridia bacterium]|nr:hypothetical protein [Clostridia bacterium]
MSRTLAPVRLMNADTAGGFQLLIRDAAEAFHLLPDMMEELSGYRKANMAMCRLAVDWVAVAVPGELNVEIRYGLHVRVAAPAHARAASISRQCDALCSELCRWFEGRNVGVAVPATAQDGTVALMPGQERMHFLSKERLMAMRSDSMPAYYYGSLESAGRLDTEAVADYLRRLGNGGVALQLFELDNWEKPRLLMEKQLEKLVDSRARSAVEAMTGAAVRYGFNLIVWGGERRDSGAAARELCKLLQSAGVYLRCPGPGIMRKHQYYQAIYDVWALHSHVGGYIGIDSPADMRCMANVLTADELRAVCRREADVETGAEAEQAAIDLASEQLSTLIGDVLSEIDDLLGEESGVPEYPVAPETPYTEASGEIRQYLARIIEMLNGIPCREEFVKLSNDVQDIRAQGYLLEEQNRRMENRQSHTEEALSAVSDDISRLKDAQAAMMKEIRDSGASAQEALKILLERIGKRKTATFHPEQLKMMGYATEEELNADLKARGLSDEEIRELRCVAVLSWEGIHEGAADFEVYGWALGCFYEKLVMDTFGKLYQKESEARKKTLKQMFPQPPAQGDTRYEEYDAWSRELLQRRVDLAAFDGLSGKAWKEKRTQQGAYFLDWGHLDYWRLNAYAQQATRGVGQELSGAQARAFWNSWFMIMTCVRRFRNSFVHSDEEGNHEAVKKETLQAAYDLLFAKGTEKKKQALAYFAGLPVIRKYQPKFLAASAPVSQMLHNRLTGSLEAYVAAPGSEKLTGYFWDSQDEKKGSAALLNEIGAHVADNRYADSLLTFLLKCKKATWGE